MSLASIPDCMLSSFASRRRSLSQYRASVAVSPPRPSTAMVVAQPVALEFSPPGNGKS